MSSLDEIVELREQGGYDLIIGFGGGSADRRRQGRRRCCAGSDDTVETTSASTRCPKKGLPIIAVPTTAGTGSEVTAIAIFANEKLNVKQGVVARFLIPNVALVDPMLTVSCPPHVTAASGMDALIHNIEAYISVNATMHTDPLAREGIKLIIQEHPHRRLRRHQRLGPLRHGHGLAARRHRLRQRRRRRRARAVAIPSAARSTCRTASPTR